MSESIRARLEQRKATAEASATASPASQANIATAASAAPSTSTGAGSVSELADQFTLACEQLRKAILAELESLKSSTANDSNIDTTQINSKLIDLRSRVLKQQQDLARISATLPLFTRRQSTDTLNGLLTSIDRTRSKLIGTSRFRFIRRPLKAGQSIDETKTSQPTTTSTSVDTEGSSTSIGQPTISNIANRIVYYVKRTPAEVASDTEALPSWTHKHLGDAATQLPIEIHPIEEVGSDLWISSVSHALLVILAPLTAVRVDRLENAVVVLGPVAGSVHIEHATQSCVIVACRQIRIHSAKHVDFMLSTMSRPIIEHSGPTSFAPYPLRYTGLGSDIAETKIIVSPELKHPDGYTDDATAEISPEDEKKQMWTQVDDFNWLRQTQSPNWSIVPTHQRLVKIELPRIV